jgi:hypothetical protein
MSLTTFLSNIWAEVKGLFNNISPELKTAIHIGVIVTENIKSFVDELITLLRAKLPEILTELKLADSCGSLTDPSAITACAVKVLQGLSGDVSSAFLHSLSILVAQVAADGKLTWSDGVYLLEWYYQHEYKITA